MRSSVPVQQAEPPGALTPRRAPRWWAYVAERRLCCGLDAPEPGAPAGHHIPAHFEVGETGFVRCQKFVEDQEARGRTDAERRAAGRELQRSGHARGHLCDRWVFIYAIRGGRCIVVEVEEGERAAIRRLGTPAEMLDYLGIFAQPVR
jgi:hypothetical protein